LNKLYQNTNIRLNQIKEDPSGEEIAQFIVAYDIFKELFEEKTPIEVYYSLKSQIEKLGIQRTSMKIILVDEFM
jgi:hypothetical protein